MQKATEFLSETPLRACALQSPERHRPTLAKGIQTIISKPREYKQPVTALHILTVLRQLPKWYRNEVTLRNQLHDTVLATKSNAQFSRQHNIESQLPQLKTKRTPEKIMASLQQPQRKKGLWMLIGRHTWQRAAAPGQDPENAETAEHSQPQPNNHELQKRQRKNQEYK